VVAQQLWSSNFDIPMIKIYWIVQKISTIGGPFDLDITKQTKEKENVSFNLTL
jgi:hypothetical protein